MFEVGFLGTRAPIFMDIVTLIVALLPFLITVNIMFAKSKKYKLHAFAQRLVFVVTIVVLVYFEVGVRLGGGFNAFMDGSGVSHGYAFFVLLLHIAIATITIVLWAIAIFKANKFLRTGVHKLFGRILFVGIVLTSLSGIWVYLILFVY
ncbi:MAG: DUF420 domain-containing protein [Epsilonproteobacteria bacterium]|nr:DUF420 domain-containing protein [Campylobacterota bacterium]